MTHVTDEDRFHLVALLGTVLGDGQFLIMLAHPAERTAAVDDDHQQADDDDH